MKTLHYFLYCFIAMFLTACNSNEPQTEEMKEAEETQILKGVKYTLCQDKKTNRGLPGAEESYLTYKVEGNTLKVGIYNYIVDCATEKVTAEANDGDNNQIEVKLTQISELSADCVCPMDVSFPLTNLKEGNTYECVIKSKSVSGSAYFPLVTFTFIMKNGESGKIVF